MVKCFGIFTITNNSHPTDITWYMRQKRQNIHLKLQHLLVHICTLPPKTDKQIKIHAIYIKNNIWSITSLENISSRLEVNASAPNDVLGVETKLVAALPTSEFLSLAPTLSARPPALIMVPCVWNQSKRFSAIQFYWDTYAIEEQTCNHWNHEQNTQPMNHLTPVFLQDKTQPAAVNTISRDSGFSQSFWVSSIICT